MERNRREGDGRGKDRVREREREREWRYRGGWGECRGCTLWFRSATVGSKCVCVYVCVGVGVHALIVYKYTCVSVQR